MTETQKAWASSNALGIVQLLGLAIIFYITTIAEDSSREHIDKHDSDTTAHIGVIKDMEKVIADNAVQIQLLIQKHSIVQRQNELALTRIDHQIEVVAETLNKIAIKQGVEMKPLPQE